MQHHVAWQRAKSARPSLVCVPKPKPVLSVFTQDAKALCREVSRMLKLLKSNRDMSVNEVKLTLAIEDPRARERRESMGIEVRLT